MLHGASKEMNRGIQKCHMTEFDSKEGAYLNELPSCTCEAQYAHADDDEERSEVQRILREQLKKIKFRTMRRQVARLLHGDTTPARRVPIACTCAL